MPALKVQDIELLMRVLIYFNIEIYGIYKGYTNMFFEVL